MGIQPVGRSSNGIWNAIMAIAVGIEDAHETVAVYHVLELLR